MYSTRALQQTLFLFYNVLGIDMARFTPPPLVKKTQSHFQALTFYMLVYVEDPGDLLN